MICQSCGIEAPTKYVEFYQNIGALVVRFHKKAEGNLCKKCINQYFWRMTLTTLFLGWWGVISFFFTLFILPNNIIRYLGALGLEPPAVNARQPELRPESVDKLKPYFQEIVTRLNQGEDLAEIAQDVGGKAGVGQAEVVIFVRAMAALAKNQLEQ
jgi:hypothetical protein